MSDLLHNSPLVTNLIGIQSKIRILRYEYKTGGLKFKNISLKNSFSDCCIIYWYLITVSLKVFRFKKIIPKNQD